MTTTAIAACAVAFVAGLLIGLAIAAVIIGSAASLLRVWMNG